MAQIQAHNGALNAIVTLDEEEARLRAKAADRAMARKEYWGPLHGLPMTLKDSHSTMGMRTTVGFPPLADYVPQQDGTVAARLKHAGAIILGKTNVPTMVADYQTDNPIFGRTNNPYNLGCTPGGSSGGAAAALASGMTPLEIGSDVGSSIRVPAHFTGLYGLKPTERRVSLAGHIPPLPGDPSTVRGIATIGPMARSIDDLDLALRIISGADILDPETAPITLGKFEAPKLKDLKIAFISKFPNLPIAYEISSEIEKLVDRLEDEGVHVEQTFPSMNWEQYEQLYQNIESFIVETFPHPPEGKEPISLAQYYTTMHLRDQFVRIWDVFFDQWDVLMMPVCSTVAFPHCETGSPLNLNDGTVDYFASFTPGILINMVSNPAMVIPIAQNENGLPIGIQLVGRRWEEGRLLGIAKRIADLTAGFQRPSGF